LGYICIVNDEELILSREEPIKDESNQEKGFLGNILVVESSPFKGANGKRDKEK
jgi:hypothetical protein